LIVALSIVARAADSALRDRRATKRQDNQGALHGHGVMAHKSAPLVDFLKADRDGQGTGEEVMRPQERTEQKKEERREKHE